MVRAPYYDKNGLKKGAWTREEDDKLRNYIKRYGAWNWRQLPRFAGLARCGKSCRLRWLNYLHPGLKHGNYTKEEEDLIIKLHAEHGNKWSLIAAKLPGRTDNEIKNYWHAHLKKRAEQEKLEKVEKRTVLPDLNMPDESNDEQSSEEVVELNKSDESSLEVIDLNKSDEFNDEQSSEELIDLNKSDEQSSEDVLDLNRFDRFNDEQSSEEASQSEITQISQL